MNKMPSWVQAIGYIGLPGFIALYLLGAIPGLRSPFDEINESLKATAHIVDQHARQDNERLRLIRLICEGIWRNNGTSGAICNSD